MMEAVFPARRPFASRLEFIISLWSLIAPLTRVLQRML